MFDKMDRGHTPNAEDIRSLVNNPVWSQVYAYLTEECGAKPSFEYSGCVWPGWNVKFKKSGRNLCTIYPFEGSLWVLVVIGQREKARFEAELPFMSSYLQNLYQETEEGMGQRWLRIVVEDASRLPDVRQCVAIRRSV